MMRNLYIIMIGGLFIVLAFGCAHSSELRHQMNEIQAIIEQAEQSGAYQCAPRALAIARANLFFAHNEFEQGDTVRARQHLEVALPNANAALRLSPHDRCARSEENHESNQENLQNAEQNMPLEEASENQDQ